MLWQQDLTSGRDRITLSPAEYRAYADGQTAFDSLAAMRGVSLNANLGDAPTAVDGLQVTPNFFATLGIKVFKGRGFGPEDLAGSGQEAVVTYEFWQRALGGSPNVLGQTLTLRAGFTTATPRAQQIDGSYFVIGVLPRGLKLPYRAADIWIPLALDDQRATAETGGLLVFGRLRPGMTLNRAGSEAAATAQRLRAQFPERSRNLTAWLVSLRREDIGDISPTLILLASSVGLLSLIVCANIGNMLLSRLTERQRELAVRRALGASRSRLVQQLLTEGFILAFAGAVVGILLASWITQLLIVVGPATIPRLNEVRVDRWALLVAFSTALAMSVIFGIAPALKFAWPTNGNHLTMRAGSAAAVGRLREGLVIAEFALAFVVLVGASLVLTSARALEFAPVGYDAQHVLTFRVSLPEAKYAQPERRAAFFSTLLDRLRALPSVTSAGAVSILPQMDTNRNVEFQFDGGPATLATGRPNVRFRIATPGYFVSLGIRVLAGREFQNEDVTDGAIVISRSMAARFWPNTNAVGRHLRLMLPAASTPWLPVVGVVEDVRQWINTPGEPTLYWASLRQPAYGVTIRTAAEPATLRSAVNRVVQQIDPDQPVFDVQTMQERLGHSQQLTYERFRTTVMGAFGVAALFLAGFGIYGVVRYAVVQRTQEFGIRMALGASPRQITAMIVLQSLRSVLIGGTIGLLGSLALGRLLRTMLYGAADSDPLLVGGVAFLLAALATVAAVGPARRAGSADPMRSLRAE